MKYICVLLVFMFTSAAFGKEPVKIIFDTDMGNDVDDALALSMIHALKARNELEVLAITITKDNPHAASYIDAVNTHYGNPNIPIGIVKNGPTKDDGKFIKIASEKVDGKLKYPHDLTMGKEIPDATKVLRKALASQPDNSVVIVQVGFSTNVSRLLDSKGDDISPLSGIELVNKKVKYLSAMFGLFRITPNMHNKDYREYNVYVDLPSSKNLLEKWPKDIIFSGFEIGENLHFPRKVVDQEFNYVKDHIVKRSFYLYTGGNRPTWDLTNVLEAARPGYGYFEMSRRGTVSVDQHGNTNFTSSPNGKHRYFVLNEAQKLRIMEALTLLSTQPPSK
ncbi:MAG: nucleoside hydrolase [Lentisphaeraceae bacterium]|nr:nucleoside hydrolase [Lentisphaeraceae bacterium]